MCLVCGEKFKSHELALPLYRWGINFAAPMVRGYIHAHHVDEKLKEA